MCSTCRVFSERLRVWRGPRAERGGPRAELGGPRAELGGPRAELGGPRADWGSPRAEWGGPRADIAPCLRGIWGIGEERLSTLERVYRYSSNPDTQCN